MALAGLARARLVVHMSAKSFHKHSILEFERSS